MLWRVLKHVRMAAEEACNMRVSRIRQHVSVRTL